MIHLINCDHRIPDQIINQPEFQKFLSKIPPNYGFVYFSLTDARCETNTFASTTILVIIPYND
jgi:hypothetical protein